MTFGLLLFLPLTKSYAVPSFTRQTGYACADCHTVFPELTPLGRSFKLRGYVQERENMPQFFIPLSVIGQASYTVADTSPAGTGLTSGVAPFDSTNNNATDRTNIPQQLNIFYAGRIYDNIGGMVQATYDGTANALFLDNTDVRYANVVKLAGKDLVCGITLNNSPTTQDVWDTVPAWSFPFASSFVALTPAASPLITGLGQQVGGIGAYCWWNDMVYAEASVYRTTRNGITMPLGAGSTPPSVVVKDAAPYWRLALQHNWQNQSVSVGTFGIYAEVSPPGTSTGPTDKFTDLAADAQYQYIGKNHLFSVEATFIHENVDWDGSSPLGLTANGSDKLDSLKANATYTYRSGSKWGDVSGTLAYFYTSGTRDTGLFAPAPFTGSSTGLPDSNGFILEADYLPWQHVKIGAQYTIYNKFNGASSDYDGSGTDASHNNTLYLYAQLAF